LKQFSVNHKNVKSLNQNNNFISSKILIKKIKDTQISKEKKTTQNKQKIIHIMQIKGLAK